MCAFMLVLSGSFFIPFRGDKAKATDIPTTESDVPVEMLDIKVQASSDGTVLRFITAVDSLNYEQVGFRVTPEDGSPIVHPIKTVYEKIDSTTNGVEYKFSPKVVDSSAEYLATAKMKVTDAELDYTVQAYVVLLDGTTTVYGTERRVSANDGLNTSPINMAFEVSDGVAATLQSGNATIHATYGDDIAADSVELLHVSGNTVQVRVDLNGNATKDSLSSATKFVFKLATDNSEIGTLVYRNYYTSYEKTGADVTWLTAYTYATTNEFIIATDADLFGLAKLTNEDPYKYTFVDKTIVLISDVAIEKNVSTANAFPASIKNRWTPIAKSNWFNGTFDADGNTISGIYENNPSDRFALFGQVDAKATIKNLHIENCYIYNKDGDGNGYYIGAVAGRVYGGGTKLESIYVHDDVKIESDCQRAGGLVGMVQGGDGATIRNCWFAGTFTHITRTGSTEGSIGGFVGRVDNQLSFIDCLYTGKTSSDAKAVGGLIGEIWASKPVSITNCLIQGTITCANADYAAFCGSGVGWMNAGGIVLTIDKSYTTGNVVGTADSASGAVGIGTKRGTVNGSFKKVSNEELKGTNAFTSTELFASGKVWIVTADLPLLRMFSDTPSDWYYGKLDGTIMPESTKYIISSAEEFSVFKDIVNAGDNFSGDTVKLSSDIDLNPGWDATSKAEPEGGLIWSGIGSSSKPFAGIFNGQGYTIKGVYMDATGASGDGMGLFNYVNGATITNLKMDNSYYVNNTSRWWSGSVVGWFNGGTMSNVSASDSVILNCSSFGAGGLVGLTRNVAVNITECQFTGEVSTTRRVGGIVGEQRSDTDITNCLVDAQVISTDTVDNNAQAGAFVGCVASGKLIIENSLALGEVKAPTANGLGHIVGYSATSVKLDDVYYANVRTNMTGGNVADAVVEYDTSGDMPIQKTIGEIQSGNMLFAGSSAWIYAEGKTPQLSWLTTAN